jgi:cell division protein FtsB
MVFRLLSSAVFLLIAGYLGYHGFYGQRGYYSWQTKKNQVEVLRKRYQSILFDKETLQNKVSLLQNDIDPDLLEQYAWFLFRYVDPENKVLLYR